MTQEKRPYREGDDDSQPVAEAATPTKDIPINAPEPDVNEAFTPKDTGKPFPDPSKEPASAEEEVLTAVLLVHTSKGEVLPITNLDNIKMHHRASPHEVFRMAADVADQISSVRIIGEVVRNQHEMLKRFSTDMLKAFGTMIGARIGAAQGAAPNKATPSPFQPDLSGVQMKKS